MRALVVYESMLVSTRELAEAIAEGMRSSLDVRLSAADQIVSADAGLAELVVAGGPNQSFPDGAPASREDRPGSSGTVGSPREWFDELHAVPGLFAAFDTRADIPRLPTGAASVRIGRELRLRGSTPVVPPESFLVNRFDGLRSGEAARARSWGEQVAEAARRARPRTATETAT